MPTSTAGNKGFTLVELLVVLLIIGVMTSLVSLSLKAAQPSAAETLLNQLKTQFMWAKQYAQLMNQPTRIQLKGTQSTVQRWQTQRLDWVDLDKAPQLTFADLSIQSELRTIEIRPNGFITPVQWVIKDGKDTLKWSPADE